MRYTDDLLTTVKMLLLLLSRLRNDSSQSAQFDFDQSRDAELIACLLLCGILAELELKIVKFVADLLELSISSLIIGEFGLEMAHDHAASQVKKLYDL